MLAMLADVGTGEGHKMPPLRAFSLDPDPPLISNTSPCSCPSTSTGFVLLIFRMITAVRARATRARTPRQPPTNTTAAAKTATRTPSPGNRQWSLTSTYGSDPSAWDVNVTTTSSPAAYVDVSWEPPGPARYALTSEFACGPSRTLTVAMETGGVSLSASSAGGAIDSIRPRYASTGPFGPAWLAEISGASQIRTIRPMPAKAARMWRISDVMPLLAGAGRRRSGFAWPDLTGIELRGSPGSPMP